MWMCRDTTPLCHSVDRREIIGRGQSHKCKDEHEMASHRCPVIPPPNSRWMVIHIFRSGDAEARPRKNLHSQPQMYL